MVRRGERNREGGEGKSWGMGCEGEDGLWAGGRKRAAEGETVGREAEEEVLWEVRGEEG